MEREILMGVWLGGGVEKNVVEHKCFLLEPTKKFSPQNIKKTSERSSLT